MVEQVITTLLEMLSSFLIQLRDILLILNETTTTIFVILFVIGIVSLIMWLMKETFNSYNVVVRK